jgi:vancomycin permeability regulator SanA
MTRGTWLTAFAIAVPAIAVAPWAAVRAATAGSIHRDTGDFAHADVAVVLGARVYEDGRPSRFLRERVEVGVGLYVAGVVGRILMSGDGNDSSGCGETAVMRKVAEDMGVPASAIEEDPLGVDTYSTCVRARDEFGAQSVIMVSQEFHVPRAVWVCQRAGMPAQGAYPAPRLTSHTCYGHIREVPAVAKTVLDVWRGRDPDGASDL